MENHSFLLTAKQKKSVQAGNGVQLSFVQMTDPSKVHRHPVEFQMYPLGVVKVKQAISQKKGVRLVPDQHFTNEYSEYSNDDIFEGGDLFKEIGSAFKSSANSVKKTANNLGKSISKEYKSLNKAALKADVGGVIEQIKQGIGKNNTQLLLQGALLATGMDETSASVMAGSATGAIYNVDFGESLKGQGDEALVGGIQGGVQSALSTKKPATATATTGKGFFRQNKMTTPVRKSKAQLGGSFTGNGLGNGFFDQKKMEDAVRKSKAQIASGGSFTGNGLYSKTKLDSAVRKSKAQIAKEGGSFRD